MSALRMPEIVDMTLQAMDLVRGTAYTSLPSEWSEHANVAIHSMIELRGYGVPISDLPAEVLRQPNVVVTAVRADSQLASALVEALNFLNHVENITLDHVELVGDRELAVWLRTPLTKHERMDLYLDVLRAWRESAPWARSMITLVMW